LSRAFDQENLDVGLHRAPVVICADRAGVTGDDGPSHHGLVDMVLGLAVPDLAIFAPSEPAEIGPMLSTALAADGPSLIRYPKTPGPLRLADPGVGYDCRILEDGDDNVVLIGVGKMAQTCLETAALLRKSGVRATVIDPRVIRPLDPDLIVRAAAADLVVTAEDGLLHGGAGQYIRSQIENLCVKESVAAPTFSLHGIPTQYLAQASPATILARAGLDAAAIADATVAALGRIAVGSRARRSVATVDLEQKVAR
jgi:1-deoxy-D-xylulose-5-phosphate synthase